MDATQCPHCAHLMEPVMVAGHTQCPYCHQVVDECCSGETIGIRKETEPHSLGHVTPPPRPLPDTL